MAYHSQAADEEAREMECHRCDEFWVPVSYSLKTERLLWSHNANTDQCRGRVRR